LKLDSDSSFSAAFPATSIPKIKLHMNRPRLDKDVFSALLVIKLDQARRFFGLNHTPKCYPTMISHWLTSLLRSTHSKPQPTPATKKTKPKADSRKEKIPAKLSERFQPSTAVEDQEKVNDPLSSPPQSEIRSEWYLRSQDLPALTNTQLRADFIESLFPDNAFSYPSSPPELNHAEIRSLLSTVKMYCVKRNLTSPVSDVDEYSFRLSYLLLLKQYGITVNLSSFCNRPVHLKDLGLSFSDPDSPHSISFNLESIRAVLNDMDYLVQIYH
jgi:hypothetical protein